MGIIESGSARPKVSLDITTQVAGEIVSKADNFISSERVQAGQVLFVLDPTDYTLAGDQADQQIALIDARLGAVVVKEGNLGGTLERSSQAQFLKSMVVSIAFGLSFATLLTPLAVPSLYLIGNDLRRAGGWLVRGEWPSAEEVIG